MIKRGSVVSILIRISFDKNQRIIDPSGAKTEALSHNLYQSIFINCLNLASTLKTAIFPIVKIPSSALSDGFAMITRKYVIFSCAAISLFAVFSQAFATDYNCTSPEVIEKLHYIDMCSAADGSDYCAKLGLNLTTPSDIEKIGNDDLVAKCTNLIFSAIAQSADRPLTELQQKAWQFYCALKAPALKEEEQIFNRFKFHEAWSDDNSGGHSCVATASINVGETPAARHLAPLSQPYDRNSEDSAASVAFADIANGSSTDWQQFEKLYRRHLYVASIAAPFSNPTKDLEIPYTVETDGNGGFRILKGQIREGSPPPKSNGKIDWHHMEPTTAVPSTVSPPPTDSNTRNANSPNEPPQLSLVTMPADGQDPNGLLAVLLKVTSNDERPFIIKKFVVNDRCQMSTNGNPVTDLARVLQCDRRGQNTEECLSNTDSPRTFRRGDIWSGVVMTINCGQPTTVDIQTTLGSGHYRVASGSSSAALRDCLASNPYSRSCPLDDEYCREAEHARIFEQNCYSRFAN